MSQTLAVKPRSKPLKLEVLKCLPAPERARQTPVVFVHGAYVAAWCWQDYFLPFFAEQGFAAYAVSLRGHGRSEGRERLPWISMRDYVRDLGQVVKSLPRRPVLVGHSMGGMVVQRYLERHSVAAAVLMASPPPEGLTATALWLAWCHPLVLWQLNVMALGGPVTVEGVRRALFSPSTPQRDVLRFVGRSQQESHRAVLDMHWLDVPVRTPANPPPTLVLGAADDALIPRAAVGSTARAFRTEAEIFADLGHAMMVDSRWQVVAGRIVAWLSERGF